MGLGEHVRVLESLIDNTKEKVKNSELTLKDILLMPVRGTIGGFTPNNIKQRYFVDNPEAILDRRKVQKSSEIWLFAVGAVSTYLAFKGLGFNSHNPVAEIGVRASSISFLGYACLGIADTVFRLTGHYKRKKKPGTITNELLYSALIERGIGEERFFSLVDGAISKISEFYYLNLPVLPLPR